jgi:hypothetical protein
VASEGDHRDKRIYTAIAIFVIVVIILTVFFSTNQLTPAKIEDNILGSWREDISERDSGSELLGLTKWASFTYRNYNDSYPAYVTVTTSKTLFMKSESELRDDMEKDIINKASEQGIFINMDTKITGGRALNNSHKTMYVVYDGNYTSNKSYEQVKIIGETWNCDASGTSIICIGFAQVTDNAHGNPSVVNTYWEKIVGDKDGTFGVDFIRPDGLIFNVKCH